MTTDLYLQAVTHSSHAHEHGGTHNERLEFLGDAVLELCITRLLFDALPDAREGELSRTRQRLVNRETLADLARMLELDRHMRLGAGEETSALRQEVKPLSDLWEAMLGALYLDLGLDAAMEVVAATVLPRLGEGRDRRDPKSRLQEWCQQQRGGEVPTYELTGRSGPDNQPVWRVVVKIGGEALGEGAGRKKKDAERQAARAALGALGLEPAAP